MRNLKYHPHGSVLYITFSLEQGLLLPANKLTEAIVKSCLARAQHLYPIKICHFIVSANHIHLLAVVENPSDVANFMRYFKAESAHMLNGLLGRDKRTIWCEGYDSPVVLSPIKAQLVVSYIYNNPSKDDLEKSIDAYPGFSSWSMFRQNKLVHYWKRFHRPQFKKLKDHRQSTYTREAERLVAESKRTYKFTLSPNAWLTAFAIREQEHANWNERLVDHIRRLEARQEEARQREGRGVIGAERLRNQPMCLDYQSARSGKRMWCLSEDRSLRVAFIDFMKDLKERAKYVRDRWKLGDFSIPFPLGLYPPSMPKLAEPLRIW